MVTNRENEAIKKLNYAWKALDKIIFFVLFSPKDSKINSLSYEVINYVSDNKRQLVNTNIESIIEVLMGKKKTISTRKINS